MLWSHSNHLHSPIALRTGAGACMVVLAMCVLVFSFPIQTHAAKTNTSPFPFFESVQTLLMPLVAPFRAIIDTAQAPNPKTFWSLSEKERVEFIKTIARRNALKAEDFLTKAVALRPEFSVTGHTYGHIIGEEVYRHYGVAGMRQCGMAFGFACYHGVSIAALSERPSDATIRTIEDECYRASASDRNPPPSGFTRACIHGLGHGIASMEAFDIGAFTTRCDVASQGEAFFSDELDVYTDSRIACNNGAFMEFILGSGLMLKNPDTLWNICASLDEKRHQYSCALFASMIPQAQGNIRTVSDLVDFCRTAPTLYMRNSCLGESALLGITIESSYETLVTGCATAKSDASYYTHCINVAAGFVGLNAFIGKDGAEHQTDTASLRIQMNTVCGALSGKDNAHCIERNEIIISNYTAE